MTDAEIIKALECCTNDDNEPNCKECTKRPHIYCICELLEDAYGLIKRQQAKIDELKKRFRAEFEEKMELGIEDCINWADWLDSIASEMWEEVEAMTDKLRECPFCGGDAMLRNRCMNTQNYVVCENCGAVSKITETEADAIKAWNTRKPMDRIVEQLEKEAKRWHESGKEFKDEKELGVAGGFRYAIAIVKGVQND